MSKVKTILLICALALSQGACVNTTQWQEASVSTIPINHHLFDSTASVPDQQQLIAVNDKVEQDFFAFFNKPELALYPAAERVGLYLGLLVDQFEYSDHTYTAQEALDNQGGNCLSLTLLTTALAKLAGVNVSYDLLGENPSFAMEDNTLVSADHMRAVLWVNSLSGAKSREGRVLTKRITIDYFSSRGMRYIENVSSDYQMSLYYSNRAAELLVARDETNAFHYAQKALEVHKGNSSALNTLAIVHKRQGDYAGAEAIYLAAINQGYSQQALFYRSYISLLESQGRDQEVTRLKRDYQSVRERQHPVEWIRAAKKAHAQGNYYLADKLYEKALQIAPDLHDVYILRAQSSLEAGDADAAKRQIERALSLSVDSEQVGRYQRKLTKLGGF